MPQTFTYSAQIRKWLLQIIRVFGEFQVQYGVGGDLVRVPCIYGDSSLQASSILTQNSANMMQAVPRMAVTIAGLSISDKRRQIPTGVKSQTVRTREYDTNTQEYLTTPGPVFTIQKLMPTPYDMKIRLDIWTSNTQQKLQLLEQILPLFNPSMELQSNEQYFDWTSLSVIALTDVAWTSRTVPGGTGASDAPLDIATLTFEVPIWLTLPAQVTKANIIYSVITNLYDIDGNLNHNEFIEGDFVLASRQVVTFNDYSIFVNSGNILLLQSYQEPTGNNSLSPGNIVTTTVDWNSVLDKYGNVTPGVSQIRLAYDTNNPNVTVANTITGTISVNSANSFILTYDVDTGTTPVDTLTAIDQVINPLSEIPSGYISGTRYLLSSNVGSANAAYYAAAWGNVVANKNDIIQYNGTNWFVSFDSANTANIQFVSDLSNLLQYRWAGSMWTSSWEGRYPAGSWSLVL